MDRFARRVVEVEPQAARPYDAAEWRDAIVVVERGEIEVEPGDGGVPVRFGPGDVVTLDGLAARALRNRGATPAVLVAVSRRLRLADRAQPIARARLFGAQRR